MWKYHCMAFVVGFVLDLIVGDPHSLPHPVCLIGRLISTLEKRLHTEASKGQPEKERRSGAFLVLLVLLCTGMVTLLFLAASYKLHPLLGVAVETVMTCQILATKCLRQESMKVYDCLNRGSLPDARKAVAMIVGRDTDELDEAGVIRAAVETVAENTSDGVIAPMLYTALGGPVFGFLYKAVNTMDSMIGYKNDRYLHFGRTAAKLDDVVNYLPSRISAWLMIGVSFLPGKGYNGKEAYRIYKRDRRKHASPNSAQTEAACAGALGVRLLGDASYFGKVVHKPQIGDAVREIENEDIRRVNRLLYRTAFLGEMLCLCGMLAVWLR